jgi:hypothetical protein
LNELLSEYLENFGANTSHFFGTYLISLVGRKLCRLENTTEYALGFNREDMLSDAIFSLINGHKPLSYPVRDFGGIKLLMPVWELSKKILDACYPKYSLDNYKERELDESTFQRNLIYYLAHGMEDVFPNFGLSLLQGLQKLYSNNWDNLKQDEFDLFLSSYADPSSLGKIKQLFSKYFN